MKEKIKVVLIGSGSVAQLVHLPILSKINLVEIAGLCEINKSRLNNLADKFNIKNRFTDYEEMLEKLDFDAAIISTPTNTHKNIAVECLKYGKDILIEKPVALNFQETKEINEAANKYKKNVMVGMNFRFRPDTMLLKSLISSGELGEIFYVKCGWTRPQSSSQKWFTNKSLSGGGVLLDLGIVLLDTALWLLDYPKIKTSSAQNFYHLTQPLEDSSIGFIRLANSSVIHYEASWAVQDETNTFKLASFGTQGTGHLNPLRAYKKIASTKVDLTINPFSQVKSLFNKSYENEIKHFIGVVRDSIPIISSIDEALSIMKLIENLYISAKNKTEVIN